MLSKKERQLLQYLENHRDSYTTSKQLADYLSCSDRTLRTYLKQINEVINPQPTLMY